MRTNEEFRKLVDDKHKSLIQNRKQNQKRMVGLLSCLVVCVFILTIFLSNNEYKKIWGIDTDYGVSDNSTNESHSVNSSDRDTLQNDDHNHSNTSSNEDISNDESFDIQSSEDISDEPIISEPDPSTPDNAVPNTSEPEISDETSDKKPDDMSDDISETPNPFPPFANLDYVIVPDDFPNITKTENLMQYLTPTKKPNEPSDDVGPDDVGPDDTSSDTSSDDTSSDDTSSDDTSSDDTPDEVPSDKANPFDDTETQYGIADFGFELFKNTYSSNQNNLLSPTATLYSLAMLTNGAHGNTQDQLVDTLCGTSLDRMNEYLCEYRTVFGQGKNYNVNLNSAVWYDDSVTVDKNFLQTNCDYYGIDAYKTIFGTQDALNSANGWIQEKSSEHINEITDKFDSDAVSFVANNLHFEARWQYQLFPDRRNNTFTNAAGEETTVEMLTNFASFRYLENNNCTGFIYNFSAGYSTKYRFVALLPKENTTVEELINSLNSETYFNLINNSANKQMVIYMPKFNINAEIELSDALKSIGITEAFDAETADFSRMGICENTNLCLDNITQKVTLSVHQNGTLDSVEAPKHSVRDNIDVEIILNRPFVYMIIDDTTNLPMFIGTVEDFE